MAQLSSVHLIYHVSKNKLITIYQAYLLHDVFKAVLGHVIAYLSLAEESIDSDE